MSFHLVLSVSPGDSEPYDVHTSPARAVDALITSKVARGAGVNVVTVLPAASVEILMMRPRNDN